MGKRRRKGKQSLSQNGDGTNQESIDVRGSPGPLVVPTFGAQGNHGKMGWEPIFPSPRAGRGRPWEDGVGVHLPRPSCWSGNAMGRWGGGPSSQALVPVEHFSPRPSPWGARIQHGGPGTQGAFVSSPRQPNSASRGVANRPCHPLAPPWGPVNPGGIRFKSPSGQGQ